MNIFFTGFTDELTKTAGGHPLLEQISRGGTLLGKKVQIIMQRIRRGEGVTGNGQKKQANAIKFLRGMRGMRAGAAKVTQPMGATESLRMTRPMPTGGARRAPKTQPMGQAPAPMEAIEPAGHRVLRQKLRGYGMDEDAISQRLRRPPGL